MRISKMLGATMIAGALAGGGAAAATAGAAAKATGPVDTTTHDGDGTAERGMAAGPQTRDPGS